MEQWNNGTMEQWNNGTMDNRVVVVGTGYWGKNLVRNFAKLDALGGVCDVNSNVCQAIAAQYSVKCFSWQALLADQSITAVAIAVPAQLHAKLALEALSARKHVFIEKPLALNLDDAQAVVDLAQQKKRVLMVGHLLQYHPALIQLKQIVASGRIGQLQYLYSNRLNLGKFRKNEDILWSFAPHDISVILSLVNNELPTAVEATGGYYLHQSIADVTTTHLSFANGIQAHVFVSWLHPYKEQKLIVVGSKGMLVFDDTQDWADKLLLYPHHIEWHEGLPIPDKAEAQAITLSSSEPLLNECQHFIYCINTNTTPITDGEEGLRVLQVLSQASQSLRTKTQNTQITTPQNYFVHESSYIDKGVTIGQDTKVWHYSHILGGSRIGKQCTIGQNVMIGPDVIVGDRCKIQNNVSLYQGIILEDGVFCGPSCVFTNVNTPRAEIERKNEFKLTRVKKAATIGANATIVCGVTLGEYCFIGAGSVVTKDVPPHALVVGNPAKQIGWVSHAGEVLKEDLICPRDGRKYKIEHSKLQEILNIQVVQEKLCN